MFDQTLTGKAKGKILYICGSLNQTTMMHGISMHLTDYEAYFTPYYAQGFLHELANKGLLDFSILGGRFRKLTENYLKENNLRIDYQGLSHNYDLVLTCSDLIIPKNIKNKKVILVQEGMTDPKNLGFYMAKWLKAPRWIASTSTTGLSNSFDYFCVASEGYRDLFVKNGVEPEKIVVTGIPNYDNCIAYRNNEFPHKNFVLVATSDSRETFKYENRKKFILEAKEIAGDKQLIFKFHPNEDFDRAIAEVEKYAPGSICYTNGNIHEMIANCDVLITKYSTVVYTGIALGKEVHSYFDLDELKTLAPIQNGGNSTLNISKIARKLIGSRHDSKIKLRKAKKNRFNSAKIQKALKSFNHG